MVCGIARHEWVWGSCHEQVLCVVNAGFVALNRISVQLREISVLKIAWQVFHKMSVKRSLVENFQDDHVTERDLLREGVLSHEARFFSVAVRLRFQG